MVQGRVVGVEVEISLAHGMAERDEIGHRVELHWDMVDT